MQGQPLWACRRQLNRRHASMHTSMLASDVTIRVCRQSINFAAQSSVLLPGLQDTSARQAGPQRSTSAALLSGLVDRHGRGL